VKDGGHLYFLRYLEAADAGPPDSRAQAAFVLAVLCRPGGRGQVRCPPPAPMYGGIVAKRGGIPSRGRMHKPAALVLQAWDATARAWPAYLMLACTAACEAGAMRWREARQVGGVAPARAGGLMRASAQALCASAGLLHVLLAALGAAGPGARSAPPLLTKWLCLCLGRLCQDMPQARAHGPLPPLEACPWCRLVCESSCGCTYCSNGVWAALQGSCSAAAPRRGGCALSCLRGLQVPASASCCPAGSARKACLSAVYS
jgi:hypothetical protein